MTSAWKTSWKPKMAGAGSGRRVAEPKRRALVAHGVSHARPRRRSDRLADPVQNGQYVWTYRQ
jgi:hypothetical protein